MSVCPLKIMSFLTSSTPKSSNAIVISVYKILQDSRPLTERQGEKVYSPIAEAFKSGKNVILSFQNIERITWSFVTKAIGQLYEHFSEEQIESALSLVDVRPDQVAFINKVLSTKKEYLKDPENFKPTLADEELEELRRQNPHNPLFERVGIFKDDPTFDDMLAYIEEYRRELDAEMEETWSEINAEEQSK